MLLAIRLGAIAFSHAGVLLLAKGLGYIGGFLSGEPWGTGLGSACLVAGGSLAYLSFKRRRRGHR